MTGIERIAAERAEHIAKHGRTIIYDVDFNREQQLLFAARILMHSDYDLSEDRSLTSLVADVTSFIPKGWDREIWIKMLRKSYEERLVIAGSLIAAEVDRLTFKDKE